MAIIYKTASGKQPGSLSYVLSDASVDRFGDVIEPDGWDLASFQRNPIALFNHDPNAPIGKWQNIRIEDERLVAELEPAASGTSQLADEVRALIEQNILRATSVGFRALESEPLDAKHPNRGMRYLRQELLETSIVSVPANPAAINIARSLDISEKTISLAIGGQAVTGRRGITTIGRQAAAKPLMRGHQMNISQQIQEAQTRLNTSRDALTEYLGGDQQEPVQRDAMSTDIVAIEAELRSLENAERALAPRGPQQSEQNLPAPAIARRPLGLPQKEVRPIDMVFRVLASRLRAEVSRRPADEMLRQHYPGDEGSEIILRAAVAGATTTASGWAIDLVQLAMGEFVNLLYPNSVFPKLSGMGTALTFGPNAGAIKIPSRATTPSIGGTFVAESQPIPVHRLGTTSITLYPHKVGSISVYSREIAAYSNPAIEGLIRDSIVNDTSINVDALLLDNVAVSVIRPAGLTNGVSTLTATAGGGYAAFLGDINKLTQPFYAANAGRKLALLINPAQRLQLLYAPGPAGAPFGWSTQFTDMFTVVDSTSIAAGSAYMIDTVDFVSVSGAPEFEVSEVATLHMEDTTPLQIATGAQGSGVLATPTQSMFQTGQIAIRMLSNISWAMRRSGMVQFIGTGINWGP